MVLAQYVQGLRAWLWVEVLAVGVCLASVFGSVVKHSSHSSVSFRPHGRLGLAAAAMRNFLSYRSQALLGVRALTSQMNRW